MNTNTQETLQTFLLRYRDLVERKIVNNRMTLRRWQELPDDPFPKAIHLGKNSIAWKSSDVEKWLERRAKSGNAGAAGAA